MKKTIYYFSGTGNSLFVAEEIEKRLSNCELIPLVKLLGNGGTIPATEIVGFVFPTHGMTIPLPVKKFIEKIDFSETQSIFAVATRGGTIFKGFDAIDKILRKQCRKLDSTYLVTMPSNDPKMSFFENITQSEIENNKTTTLEIIDKIAKDIDQGGKTIADRNDGIKISENRLLNTFLEKIITIMTHYLSPLIKKYFYVNTNCTGCGVCEKVCLSKKIVMRNKKPYWQKNVTCYLCYGCLNYCPTKSVQIYSKVWMKSYTEEKGRYVHPYATAERISKQK